MLIESRELARVRVEDAATSVQRCRGEAYMVMHEVASVSALL